LLLVALPRDARIDVVERIAAAIERRSLDLTGA
jgi:hypothetical protein